MLWINNVGYEKFLLSYVYIFVIKSVEFCILIVTRTFDCIVHNRSALTISGKLSNNISLSKFIKRYYIVLSTALSDIVIYRSIKKYKAHRNLVFYDSHRKQLTPFSSVYIDREALT